MKECMMQIANEMAWWSILGLLSSSCCAIQIVLNALSFGCAGFNNFLGPVRPTFVALTIVAQISSWYVAYSYSTRRNQWRFTVMSSLLSVVLTLLPEALAWQTVKRERLRQQTPTNSEKEWNHSLLNEDTADTTVCGTTTTTLQFQLSTMGCSSCVSTVSKVLDGIDGAIRHTVTLEDGIAGIVLDNESSVHRHEKIGHPAGVVSMHDTLWNDIADQLHAAGFPVDICDSKKEQ
eukprot:CAMPEP_0172326768 /NCGR_PEP_ID=MMETSP1058-20130122/57525_1 /TAXON_ID=83371 /ORGANISM="Detonula confervacea, Strain CCMP 353" /LENGTH=233 /DNA_ID=CAMNT_0013043633 /DNA_START=354 /DNA_END=1055 /DNA_ORIENTATION=-